MRAAGDLRQALADYQRALGYVPYDQHVLLEVAELYRQMNQPQRALETLQNLADTYNTPAEEPQQVLYLMGLAYVALRRYDDGVESFAAAAARDSPPPEILYQLAQAQWLAGHAAEAAATAQRVLAMDPRHQPSRELLDRHGLANAPAPISDPGTCDHGRSRMSVQGLRVPKSRNPQIPGPSALAPERQP